MIAAAVNCVENLFYEFQITNFNKNFQKYILSFVMNHYVI